MCSEGRDLKVVFHVEGQGVKELLHTRVGYRNLARFYADSVANVVRKYSQLSFGDDRGKGHTMVGITAFGGYVPRLRLQRQAIVDAHKWADPGLAGKAIRRGRLWAIAARSMRQR